MKITANQLGLFIGCQVQLTPEYIAAKNYPITKNEFILSEVSTGHLFLESLSGVAQQPIAIADYGVKCKLVLKPVDQVEKDHEAEIDQLIADILGVESIDATASNTTAFSAAAVTYAYFGGDIFDWIPAGLAILKK